MVAVVVYGSIVVFEVVVVVSRCRGGKGWLWYEEEMGEGREEEYIYRSVFDEETALASLLPYFSIISRIGREVPSIRL